MDVPLWVWAAASTAIVAVLLIDLLVFHRDAHEVTMREAAITSGVWIAVGVAFGVGVAVIGGGVTRLGGGQFPLHHPHLALVCGLTVTAPEFGAEHDLQFVLLTPDGQQLTNATAKVITRESPPLASVLAPSSSLRSWLRIHRSTESSQGSW